jgi:hypothetical protein
MSKYFILPDNFKGLPILSWSNPQFLSFVLATVSIVPKPPESQNG